MSQIADKLIGMRDCWRWLMYYDEIFKDRNSLEFITGAVHRTLHFHPPEKNKQHHIALYYLR